VMWMVMREVLMLAAVGSAIGLVLAWTFLPLLQAQLFGVRSGDWSTMAVATAGLAGVAAIAGWIPARRATATDPTIALRCE